MGIGLAACAGLRAFLPLFLVGVAGRLDWVPLAGPFEWLSSWPALTVFGVAVVTEILADKIPVVDHVLDLIGGLVKPVAGAIVAASVQDRLTPLQLLVVGIVLGGGSAGAVHLAKAKMRLFSSVTTAGLGNPVLSIGEDAASFFGSLIAMLWPVLLLVVLAASLILLIVARNKLRRRAERLERRS
jgi:hypothetical protein